MEMDKLPRHDDYEDAEEYLENEYRPEDNENKEFDELTQAEQEDWLAKEFFLAHGVSEPTARQAARDMRRGLGRPSAQTPRPPKEFIPKKPRIYKRSVNRRLGGFTSKGFIWIASEVKGEDKKRLETHFKVYKKDRLEGVPEKKALAHANKEEVKGLSEQEAREHNLTLARISKKLKAKPSYRIKPYYHHVTGRHGFVLRDSKGRFKKWVK